MPPGEGFRGLAATKVLELTVLQVLYEQWFRLHTALGVKRV